MTPRGSDTAFMPASFPGVKVTLFVSSVNEAANFTIGNRKSSMTASAIATLTRPAMSSSHSAASTASADARVVGKRGVKSVQQSRPG